MQQHAIIQLILTLQAGQCLTIEGPAGSGKTWAAMAAIAKLPASAKVLICAPTHVAVDELRQKLQDATTCAITFATTASAVGRFLRMDRKTKQLESVYGSKSAEYDLVVVDELSAVPSGDLHRLLLSKSPIVALGDREQLDAVMSRTAAVWTDGWQAYAEQGRSFTYCSLAGQRRAAGVLRDVAQSYRTGIVPLVKGCRDEHGEVRVLYSSAEFAEDFLSAVRAAYAAGDDLSQLCYLAYRNKTVDAMELRLRREVFASDNWVPGEVLRVASSSQLRTGRLCTVLDTAEATTTLHGNTIRTSKVLLQPQGTVEQHWLTAVHPAAIADYALLMEQLKQDDNWGTFFALEQHFSLLSSGLAMTVHRSQGRTIRSVWMDVADIGSRRKMLYVAASRASKRLTAHWPEHWSRQPLVDALLEQGIVATKSNCVEKLNELRKALQSADC